MEKDKTSIEYLLKKSWNMLKEKIWFFLPIFFLFSFVPTTLLTLYTNLTPIEKVITFEQINGIEHFTIQTEYLIITTTLSLILMLSALYAGLTLIYYVLKGKKQDTLQHIMKATAKYYLKALALTIIISLLLIPLFALLIIPGIIFMIYWMFAQYILIDENEKVTKTLKKSRKLIQGNWWPVFGKSLLILGILIFLLMIIHVFFTAIFMIIQGPQILIEGYNQTNTLIYEVITTIINIPIGMFIIIYFVNLYKGMKKKVKTSQAS